MKGFKIFIVLISVFFLVYSCDGDKDPVKTGTVPVIIETRLKTNWNLLSDRPVIVEAKVTDPQGVSDIRGVTLDVKNSSGTVIFSALLYDDGAVDNPEAGDVFARDGVFRNMFKPSQLSAEAGDFQFAITAVDIEEHQSAVFEQNVTFGFNDPPEIVAVSGNDSLPSGAESAYLYAAVYDQNGIDEINKVVFDIYQNSKKLTLQPISMFNDGNFAKNGDTFANDSIYSFKMDSTFAAGKIGLHELHFKAIDEFEEESAESTGQIFLENKAGKILNITVPERIEKPTVTFNPDDTTTYNAALVTVKVSDPQGLADVDSVYFYSLKPNGELARDGDPLVLVDNGLSFDIGDPFIEAGDEEEGDGIYSLTVIIFNSDDTLLGTYIWSFYMRDKAGNLSTVKVDSIEVYQ